MFHVQAFHTAALSFHNSGRTKDDLFSRAISLPLYLGILIGCLIGLYSKSIPSLLDSSSLLSEQLSPSSFASAMLLAIRYTVPALLCSTSFLGVLFLPSLSWLRGVVLGCSVAALFSAAGGSGLLFAAISIGVPAFLGLSAFLLTAESGLSFSRSLLLALRSGYFNSRSGYFIKLCIPILLFSFAEAAYRFWLLPMISHSLLS